MTVGSGPRPRSAPTTSAACCARPRSRPCASSARRARHSRALRAAEDAAIRDAVALQEGVGLQGITDGEMRRKSWHMDFLLQLGGLSSEGKKLPVTFTGKSGEMFFTRPDLSVTGRVTRPRPIFVEGFRFLRSVVQRTAKLTLPSPSMLLHAGRAGRTSIRNVYRSLEAFAEDTVAAYRAEIADLYAAGCRYLQLDDVSLAYLCDEAMRRRGGARRRPDVQLALSVKMVQGALRDKPRDLTVCTHLCRGNFRSSWRAQGGYERVAETVFTQLPYDGFFLEFDDARSGDFSPLRHVRAPARVVLGLVTSKTGTLESKDDLKRRIDEAAKYVPLDQLCLSPQCGFSSTVEGNDIGVEQQRAKLALCVETAREIWGGL